MLEKDIETNNKNEIEVFRRNATKFESILQESLKIRCNVSPSQFDVFSRVRS